MCPLPWEGLRASEPSSPDGLWPLALGPRLCTSGQNTLTHAATQQEATSHRTVTGQPPLHGDHKESTAMGPSGTDTAMCIQRPGALRRPRTGPLRPPPPSTVLLVCLPMSYPPNRLCCPSPFGSAKSNAMMDVFTQSTHFHPQLLCAAPPRPLPGPPCGTRQANTWIIRCPIPSPRRKH